jgi:hypothetical protein
MLILPNRRSFLTGLTSLVAAPALVPRLSFESLPRGTLLHVPRVNTLWFIEPYIEIGDIIQVGGEILTVTDVNCCNGVVTATRPGFPAE